MAQVVAEQDVRLTTGTIEIPTPNGPTQAYVAKPKNAGKLLAVIVIHENRGLNPHIMDVARRAAVEDYLALAPDALSRTGGTPSDQDQARSLIRELDRGLSSRTTCLQSASQKITAIFLEELAASVFVGEVEWQINWLYTQLILVAQSHSTEVKPALRMCRR